jgi:hypothetical protein
VGAAVRVGEAENTLLSVVVTHLADSPVVALVRDPTGRFGERGFREHRVFFQQFSWPVYWPSYYPYDYSYLDYGPDNDYQSGDNSAGSVQPESFRPALDHGPVVVSINAGNSRPMDSSPDTAYTNSGYSSSDIAGKQRIVMWDPNEKIGPGADLGTFVPPAVPQPTQMAAKGSQTRPQLMSVPLVTLCWSVGLRTLEKM